ncbi:MAG: PAS domain-containing protein, partial [Cyanobacteria bacterium J06649_4]
MISSSPSEIQRSNGLAAVDPLSVYRALWQDRSVGWAVVAVVEGGECFRILSVNDAIAQANLFLMRGVLDKTLSEVLPEHCIQAYLDGCRCCVQTRQSVSFEVEVSAESSADASTRAAQLPRSWKISVMPMEDIAGEVYQLLLNATEVTGAKQTEARLTAALEDARTLIDHTE